MIHIVLVMQKVNIRICYTVFNRLQINKNTINLFFLLNNILLSVDEFLLNKIVKYSGQLLISDFLNIIRCNIVYIVQFKILKLLLERKEVSGSMYKYILTS